MRDGEIAGIEINFTIIQGRNLVAKDRNIFNQKTTSDPYVQLWIEGKFKGQTKVIWKNLNPTWNESFKVRFSTDESNHLISEFKRGKHPRFTLRIFDHDKLSEDDNMGIVKGSLSFTDAPQTKWMKVEKAPGLSKKVSGELEVKTSVLVSKMLTAVRGNCLSLNRGIINVVLDWKLDGYNVDLDTSCVAVASNGKILMKETVYFGRLHNTNRSIQHSGDVQSGGDHGEIITCKLDSISNHVHALYFILTVATPDKSFENVKSASVSVVDNATKWTLCKFKPSLVGDNTAMFLMRIVRKSSAPGWTMTMIEDTDHVARDFGTLIPEIKGYSKDFAPHVVVDPYERVAVLRKGGAIRLRDYLPPNQPIAKKLTFGLAWDITNGRNVDLDASAICLNSSFEPVDIVSYQKLTSADNAIIHGGDEREGDEIGDDEKIHILLDKLNPSIAHICFVVNSYSGQELDDVSSASCHIFDSQTDIDIAKYELTNNRKLDKHTGLLMASLYKDDEGCWCVWIMSEAAQGRVAKQVLPQLQSYLKKNSIPKTQDVPEADIIVNCMPQDVDIAVNLAVPINELAHDILNPTTPGTAYTSNDPFVPQVPAPSKIKNEPQSQGMFVPNIPIY